MKKESGFNLKKILLVILFIIYLIFLFRILFYRRLNNVGGLDFYQRINATTNMIPFSFLEDFSIVEVVGNFVLLMPMALFLPCLFSIKRKYQFYFIIVIITFVIELTQLLTGTGIFDINDIILNATGAILFFEIIHHCKFIKVNTIT